MNEVQKDIPYSKTDPFSTRFSALKVRLYRDLVQSEAWNDLLARLARMLGVDGMWLARDGLDGPRSLLGSFWAGPLADTLSESVLPELENPFQKWVFDDEPLIIDDLQCDPRIDPSIPSQYGIRTFIVLPLEIQGKRVGILYLADSQPHTLDPSHLPELREIAAALAYRIQKEAVSHRLEQHRHLYRALAEATRVVASELDLQPALQFIVDLARRVTGWPAGWVVLHQEAGHRRGAEIPVAQGITPAEVRDVLARVGGAFVPDTQPVRIDYKTYRRVTILPIIAGGTVLGSLGLATGEEDLPVNENARQALQSFCRLAALTIQKSIFQERLDAALTETVQALVSTLEARDPMTSAHSQRVSHYIECLVEHLDVDPPERRLLVFAGLLHDIGKIALPRHLLAKQERLSPAEWEIVRQHPTVGARIVAGVQGLKPLVPIVRHQYERYDGTGEPSKLRGPAIPQGSRVLAVVDTFDVLMSRQPHRPGFPLHRAMAALKEEAGTRLDPHLVAAFLEIAPTAVAKFLPSYEAPLALPAPSPPSRSLDASPAAGSEKHTDDLTPRELQVLTLIGMGLSNKEIAARLVVSEKTVKTHVMHIFQKLGVRDRTRAALYAFNRGLIPPAEQPPPYPSQGEA